MNILSRLAASAAAFALGMHPAFGFLQQTGPQPQSGTSSDTSTAGNNTRIVKSALNSPVGATPAGEGRNTAALLRSMAIAALNNNPRVNPAMASPPTIDTSSICAANTYYAAGEICGVASPSAMQSFFKATRAGTTSSATPSTVLNGQGESIIYGGATFRYFLTFPTTQYSAVQDSTSSYTGKIDPVTDGSVCNGYAKLTVSAITNGGLRLYDTLAGALAGATIITATAAQDPRLSGTNGVGTYCVSRAQTVASGTLYSVQKANFYPWHGGALKLTGGVPTIDTTTGYFKEISATVLGKPAQFTQRVHFVCDCAQFLVRRFDLTPNASATGSLRGSLLTLSGVSAAIVGTGTRVTAPRLPANLEVIRQQSGKAGGAGIYLTNNTTNTALSIASQPVNIGAGNYRLVVNGQYASFMPTSPMKKGFGHLIVDFHSRAVRDIIIETDAGSEIGGIDVLKTETVSPPAVTAQLKMSAIGDSYSAGGDNAVLANAFPNVLADFLGVENFSNSAIGGTGLIVQNASGTALSRINDVFNFAPDIVLVGLGGNDCYTNVATSARVGAAMKIYLNALRAGLPNALVIVHGIHGVRDYSSGASACDSAIGAAVAAFNDPTMVFIPDASSANPYFSGTTNDTILVADGNRLLYVSPSVSGAHATEAGWFYLAKRMLEDVVTALKAF